MNYFISDLHLSEAEPALTELFYRFLDAHGPHMRALYILGDFFDAWIGDDDDRPLAQAVAGALKQLTGTGCALFFMHGNRDFLLGLPYAERCGMSLLPEIQPLKAEGVLLCHGDHLCSLDLAYQDFRAQVRNPAWQAHFLAQPLSVRRAFAAKAKLQSQAHQRESMAVMAAITDVDHDAVNELQLAHPALTIIHGHTHRPGVHQMPHGQRVVLGDWRVNEASWLALDGDQGELVAHAQRWRFVM